MSQKLFTGIMNRRGKAHYALTLTDNLCPSNKRRLSAGSFDVSNIAIGCDAANTSRRASIGTGAVHQRIGNASVNETGSIEPTLINLGTELALTALRTKHGNSQTLSDREIALDQFLRIRVDRHLR